MNKTEAKRQLRHLADHHKNGSELVAPSYNPERVHLGELRQLALTSLQVMPLAT